MPRANPQAATRQTTPYSAHCPPTSVFQAGQMAAGKRTMAREPVDVAKVKVYTNRPIPCVTAGRGALSDYKRIFDELLTAPGMSVDLTRARPRA